MHRSPVTSSPAPLTSLWSGEPSVPVGVMLLGVRVTAYAAVNLAEHWRRESAGLGAVISPALLDRLMDLPTGIPVTDPVVWSEMADQPTGVVERDEEGVCVTRRLESPLTITDVVVNGDAGQELRAVQDASLFAGFTRRWVMVAGRRVANAAVLEAKLCGVGVLDPDRRVLLPAEGPVALTIDGWSWLLEEKAYRRWLTGRHGTRETESPGRATDGASGIGTG